MKIKTGKSCLEYLDKTIASQVIPEIKKLSNDISSLHEIHTDESISEELTDTSGEDYTDEGDDDVEEEEESGDEE